MHYKLLYVDTGLFHFLEFFFIQILLIDSIYIATCADTLEEMIKKNDDDINHYQEEEITHELMSCTVICEPYED